MKAYIVTLKLTDSYPLVWRKVIMPAGATFYRLHQVIQYVTNFQSIYDDEPYHLYGFDLAKTNQRVTNDLEAYEEYWFFKKNPHILEERLKTMPEDLMSFEMGYQENLKKEVRKPNRMIIDPYLETQGVISYDYDFGDGWNFSITLEDVVEDYYFGYPTLLDGAETGPPEDVGGIPGFMDFKSIYYDENHPNHEDAVRWAESTYYREYNMENSNDRLKDLRYKKTEWDKINHENYTIIEDKYRK